MTEKGGHKDGPAPSSSSRSSPGSLPRNIPNCGKCRNHGIIVALRGHKRDCTNRDCKCDCCILTDQRRKVMALQTAHLRQRRIEERWSPEKEGLPQREPTPPPLPRQPTPPPSDPVLPPQQINRRELEEHSYAANELIKIFGLHMNALPFAYAVLSAAGDLETAVDMVKESSVEHQRRRSSMDRNSPRAGSSSFRNLNGSQRDNKFSRLNLEGNINLSESSRHTDPMSFVKSRFEQSKCSSFKEPSTYSRYPTPSPPHI